MTHPLENSDPSPNLKTLALLHCTGGGVDQERKSGKNILWLETVDFDNKYNDDIPRKRAQGFKDRKRFRN